MGFSIQPHGAGIRNVPRPLRGYMPGMEEIGGRDLSTSGPIPSLFSTKLFYLREVKGTGSASLQQSSRLPTHISLQKEEVSAKAQPPGKRVTKQGILVPG